MNESFIYYSDLEKIVSRLSRISLQYVVSYTILKLPVAKSYHDSLQLCRGFWRTRIRKSALNLFAIPLNRVMNFLANLRHQILCQFLTILLMGIILMLWQCNFSNSTVTISLIVGIQRRICINLLSLLSITLIWVFDKLLLITLIGRKIMWLTDLQFILNLYLHVLVDRHIHV